MTTGFKKNGKFIPTNKGSLRTVSKEKIHQRASNVPSSIGNTELIRKKKSQVMAHPPLEKLTAYNVKTKKVEKINNPKVVTFKNGRKGVQGTGSDGTKITRIISNDHAKHLSK